MEKVIFKKSAYVSHPHYCNHTDKVRLKEDTSNEIHVASKGVI